MGKKNALIYWFTLLGLSACASGGPNANDSQDTSPAAVATMDLSQSTSTFGFAPSGHGKVGRSAGAHHQRHHTRLGHGHGIVPPRVDKSCMDECESGTECQHGRCVPVKCPKGQLRCSGECIDPKSDMMNCGGCGYPSSVTGYAKPTPCRKDPISGVCGCDPNLLDLATVCGSRCVDINADAENCGTCGHQCKGNERCDAGTCVRACPHGKTLVESDFGTFVSFDCYDGPRIGDHCAGSGDGAEGLCVSGQCQCAAGLQLCSDPDGGSFKYCADLANDREHCGHCDHNCGVGTQCVHGVCKPLPCATGQTLCRDTCVDLRSDEQACGGCTDYFPVPRDVGGEARVWSDDTGTVAADCSSGHCVCDVWSGPPDLCGTGNRTFCANFQKDRDNCGGCGQTCAREEHCVAGSCEPECGPGLAFSRADQYLESIGLRGSCVNGMVVGEACAEEATCQAGSCACPDGQTACRNPLAPVQLPAETHCANLNDSNDHCGGCGKPCDQGTACTQGTCQPLACPSGKTPCGHECVDTANDPNNCGGCNWMSGNYAFFDGGGDDASPYCNTPWSCSCSWPGTPDVCDSQCTNLLRDQNNCGMCGVACAEGEACRRGKCGAPCPAGQTFCDGYCVMGDSCGTACGGADQQCFAGGCVSAP